MTEFEHALWRLENAAALYWACRGNGPTARADVQRSVSEAAKELIELTEEPCASTQETTTRSSQASSDRQQSGEATEPEPSAPAPTSPDDFDNVIRVSMPHGYDEPFQIVSYPTAKWPVKVEWR